MKPDSIDKPFTFWDEEKQVSELHWRGHVLTGTNDATLALMEVLTEGRSYRLWVNQQWVDINRALDRFIAEAAVRARRLGDEP